MWLESKPGKRTIFTLKLQSEEEKDLSTLSEQFTL
jgi:hypothetical protein